ncbi:hypothetical protein Tco_0707891 [Tanacetum coccineum]
MDNPNLTMEEYIRLEEEKAHKHGKVFNWQTATYGKIRIDDDLHDLSSMEAEFPAIVINDDFAPQDTFQFKSQVSTPVNDEIDFRISFDESDDEDYTIICINTAYPGVWIWSIDFLYSFRKEISTNIGEEYTNMEILKCWSLETSRRVMVSKRRTFWSLNEDILKITILKTNTPYPSRKIRRIRACTHQRPQKIKDQYAVSRGLNTPYSRYGINIIFWKISNVVPTPRNPQYAVSNTWIRRIQPTSRPYK